MWWEQITPRDVGSCGKSAVVKCIRLLQFTVEYLLHTQDAYMKAAQDKAKALEKLNQCVLCSGRKQKHGCFSVLTSAMRAVGNQNRTSSAARKRDKV